MGFLLSDFHTAIIVYASNYDLAAGGRGKVSFMGFKSEEIRFKQVRVGERRQEGRAVSVLMHSVYDATYLHWPACIILQSSFLPTLGMYLGCAAKSEAFRACFGKT